LRLAAGVAAVALLGIAIEAAIEDVADVDSLTVAADRFESQTHFCPPPTGLTNADGEPVEGAGGSIWVASGAEPARVGFEPHERETRDLRAGGLLTAGAFESAADVVGYDSGIAAGVTDWVGSPAIGVGSVACSRTASDTWYFAQGSSQNGVVEQIVLYNPFPDAANVRVTTFRRGGSNAISGLSDVQVPANESTVVDFTKTLGPTEGEVGAQIVADRGRVVAWRSMTVQVEGRPVGLELTLGATEPSSTWYFPAGRRDDGAETGVVVMNPGEEQASVRLSLLTGGRPVVPPGLSELALAPGAAQRLPLDQALEGQRVPETFSLVVDSTVPIVAERTIVSTGEDLGRAAEVGSTATAESWVLLPVATETAGDRLLIMNPGGESVDVTVALNPLEQGSLTPGRLAVTIPSRRRVELPLDRWAGRAPFSAVVTATGPVVAERAGYATGRGDLVSSMGVPLDAEEEGS
jgi:hypothetical protein